MSKCSSQPKGNLWNGCPGKTPGHTQSALLRISLQISQLVNKYSVGEKCISEPNGLGETCLCPVNES